jgi:hypothetical protein
MRERDGSMVGTHEGVWEGGEEGGSGHGGECQVRGEVDDGLAFVVDVAELARGGGLGE